MHLSPTKVFIQTLIKSFHTKSFTQIQSFRWLSSRKAKKTWHSLHFFLFVVSLTLPIILLLQLQPFCQKSTPHPHKRSPLNNIKQILFQNPNQFWEKPSKNPPPPFIDLVCLTALHSGSHGPRTKWGNGTGSGSVESGKLKSPQTPTSN